MWEDFRASTGARGWGVAVGVLQGTVASGEAQDRLAQPTSRTPADPFWYRS